MMQRFIPLLVLILIVSYALYNAKFRTKTPIKTVPGSVYADHTQTHSGSHTQEALSRIRSDTYLKEYIIDVINHGSTQLHFKKDETMEAGFAPKEDAEGIACYVMALSGKKCKQPYPSEMAGYYTSICGGCHGNDGKGVHGAYPDLTRDPLLGIGQREAILRSTVAR